MNKNLKPAIVPTLLSSKGTLWSVLFVGYFLALLVSYNLQGRIRETKERLAKPVETVVSTPLFSLSLPLGWNEYAISDGVVEMRRAAGERVPFVQVIAKQNPEYAFRALDRNTAVVTRRYEDITKKALGPEMDVESLGDEVVQARPGVNALHSYLEVGPQYLGQSVMFYMGDVRYVVLAVFERGDQATAVELDRFFSMLSKSMTVPDQRESIARPLINSLNISTEQNIQVHVAVDRELALWNLFRNRARTQPAYLKEAIEHFREAIRLLSSVCEERNLMRMEDFNEYQTFLGQRAAIVREWFVRLEKDIGMKDYAAARKHAQYIIENATLVDESLDKRRASELLASLSAPAN